MKEDNSFDVWKEQELKAYLSTTKWRLGNDPSKKRRYYYDKIEKKSQWDKPKEIIDFEGKLIEKYNIYIKQIDDHDGGDVSGIGERDRSHNDQHLDIKQVTNHHVIDHNKADSSIDSIIQNDDMPIVAVEIVQSNVSEETTFHSDDNLYHLANNNDNVYHSSQATATTTDSSSTTSIVTSYHKTIPTYNECISIVNEDDSILNPSIIDICEILVENYHLSFNDVVDMLVKSYKGYPSMIAAVIECIKLAMILKDASPAELDQYVATTSTSATTSTNAITSTITSTTSSSIPQPSSASTAITTITDKDNSNSNSIVNSMREHVTVAEIAVDDRRNSEAIASSSSSSSTTTATTSATTSSLTTTATTSATTSSSTTTATTTTTTTTTVSSEEILAKIVTNIVKQAWKERYYKDVTSAEDGDDDGEEYTMPWNHSFMSSSSSSSSCPSSSSSSSSSSLESSLSSYVLSLSEDHLYSNLLHDLYDTYPNDDILKKYCHVGHVDCSHKDEEPDNDNNDDDDCNDNDGDVDDGDDSNEGADKRKRRKLT